jgi:thioredoxin-related protein
MQELVTKYNNSPVEFFFIDVWERMKPADMKTNVDKFITENKYSFHVLYDFKDEVVAKYKIEGIPTKILIDKNGKILSVVGSIDDLSELIDQNI